MNPDHFRHLYAYHFAANRRLWEQGVVGLTPEQFRRKVSFSLGSVRAQVVHMMNMDDRWFSALRQVKMLGLPGFPQDYYLYLIGHFGTP